jgi:tRNA (cmo5U34)-methyltransferase
LWGRFQLDKGKDVAAVENHKKRFNNEYFPITIIEHLESLKEIGFKTVELFWFTYMQAGFYAIK